MKKNKKIKNKILTYIFHGGKGPNNEFTWFNYLEIL